MYKVTITDLENEKEELNIDVDVIFLGAAKGLECFSVGLSTGARTTVARAIIAAEEAIGTIKSDDSILAIYKLLKFLEEETEKKKETGADEKEAKEDEEKPV